MSRLAQRIRRDQSGFTLVELLAAMSIGIIILMAAFLLLDRATAVSQEIANRQEALQRGRTAMEQIVRELRSQVCLGDEKEPIRAADNHFVTFYLDMSDGSKQVEQRTLRYDADDKAIYADHYLATGEYPELEFEEVERTRLVLDNVVPIDDGGTPRPIFRFYAFPPDPTATPGEFEQLTAPLSVDSAIRTVMVKVGFTVLPDRQVPKDSEATTLESDVYVRLADPSKPLDGPRCM